MGQLPTLTFDFGGALCEHMVEHTHRIRLRGIEHVIPEPLHRLVGRCTGPRFVIVLPDGFGSISGSSGQKARPLPMQPVPLLCADPGGSLEPWMSTQQTQVRPRSASDLLRLAYVNCFAHSDEAGEDIVAVTPDPRHSVGKSLLGDRVSAWFWKWAGTEIAH